MGSALPESVVDTIYEAALDRALWPEALARIGGAFGGVPAQLAIWDVANGTIPLAIGVDYFDGVWDVAARFASVEANPQLAIAMHLPLHVAVDQAAALGIDDFRASEIYAELYWPQRLMPLFGTVVVRSDSAFGGIALMRPDHWEPVDAQRLALGGRISAHVGRAVQLAGLFDAGAGRPGSFEAALHQTTSPIMMVNVECAITWTNPAADALLRAQDGLCQRRRRLCAAAPADDAKLSRAVANAVQGRDTTLTIRRADGPSELIVRVSPLWRSQAQAGTRVLVQVTVPRSRVRLDPAQAIDLFRLTPAEARVACEICAGARGLADVGAALNITVNTVKTLLQRVYDKTGVRSRNELAMLFANVLPPEPPVQ